MLCNAQDTLTAQTEGDGSEWYLVKRGDLEFDQGEWVRAEEVADLYAIRCFEEV